MKALKKERRKAIADRVVKVIIVLALIGCLSVMVLLGYLFVFWLDI